MNINIFNKTKENIDELNKSLKKTFSNIDSKMTFSIIFLDNNQMQKMNAKYRNIDKATDVLSFISDELDYYGDVFISLDKAKQQSRSYNHTLKREINFLAVHGYLHLKGYDHQTIKEKKVMDDLTEEILVKANLKRSEDE